MSATRPPVWLDGVESDEIPGGRAGPCLLGSDPFAAVTAAPDPFVTGLSTLLPPLPQPGSTGRGVRRRAHPEPVRVQQREARPRVVAPRRGSAIPRLSELEPLEPEDLIDRLLGEADRLRVAALAHLAEGGAPFDRFGFSPDAARRALPFFRALYQLWFRVESASHEHIPAEGPVVLVGNHAGLLPFDAAMVVVDVIQHTDPPRLPRAVVDHWAGTLPWVNVFLARLGQVIGTRENFLDLLDDGQAVLVFPEGMDGARKRITQRYRLQSFRTGFVEIALRARAPIVPVAIVGSDDQTPILFDLKPLARLLRLPVAPITPTFPWLGPLGLLPYPVGYRIVYGEPLHYHERFGPEGAGDSRLVQYLAKAVRREVQVLLDRNR